MADLRTRRSLQRRALAKIAGFAAFGGVLGAGLWVSLGFEPVDAFFNAVETLTGWVPAIKSWLAAYPEFRGWIVGPTAFGLLFLSLASFGWFRSGVLDRLFPDPPPFVRSDLDEARRRGRMLSLEGPPLPFVGRAPELAVLDDLLSQQERGFGWRALVGTSGVGKSRLGIEWLERARTSGWDIGIIDRDDFALVDRWRPRRRTALVIDEARRDWDDDLGSLLARVTEASSRGHPVVALVIDQIKPFVDVKEGADRDRIRTAERGPPLKLLPMSDAEIAALHAVSGRRRLDEASVVRESGGRPRAALILLNSEDATCYSGALTEWVDRFVPRLGDAEAALPITLTGPLFLAALAGPMETDIARQLFGPLNVELLTRFYSDENRNSLEQRLPPVVPDDLAQHLLLRLLPRIDAKLREAAVDRMLAFAPASVETRLGGVWRERPDLAIADPANEAAAALRWLQERFDAACPERVASARERLSVDLETVSPMSPDFDPVEAEASVARIVELLATRPLDALIQFEEALAAVNAIAFFGMAENFQMLEAWGDRLAARMRDERFSNDIRILLAGAEGACNAILSYGMSHDFANLERWAGRLVRIAEHDQLVDHPRLALVETTAVCAAIQAYARVGDQVGIARWGRRLDRYAQGEWLAGDIDRHRREAGAALAAARAYAASNPFPLPPPSPSERLAMIRDEPVRVGEGRRVRFINGRESPPSAENMRELERWVGLLSDLARRFPKDADIRGLEAAGIGAAMRACGLARNFGALEAWGARLAAIVEDEFCSSDPDIRFEEGIAAGNVMLIFARADDFDGLERWGRRVVALAEDARFRGDRKIRAAYAIAASQAVLAYSEAGSSEAMERWAEALLDLAADERFNTIMEIRLAEASAVVDAIGCYGRCNDFRALERWGSRFASLSSDPGLLAHPSGRMLMARGAANSIIYYGKAGRHDWPAARVWRQRLAHLALQYPFDPEVQYQAQDFGLTAVSQRLTKFPHGKPAESSIR